MGKILWGTGCLHNLIKISPTSFNIYSWFSSFIIPSVISSSSWYSVIKQSFPPPSLFIYSVIFISMNSWILIYSMVKSITCIVFIPELFQVWPTGASSSWFQCFLTNHVSPRPFPIPWFFEHFLSAKTIYSRFIFYFICPSSDISHFSKGSFLFLVENTFRYQNLKTRFQDF